MVVGFNLYQLACKDEGGSAEPWSWKGYGHSLGYLCIQVLLLGVLLVWLDSDLNVSMFRWKKSTVAAATATDSPSDETSTGSDPSILGAEKEAVRVELGRADDLLRAVHISKSFNGLLAVDDVFLGLAQGEILALLGPNGAGKTTIVNMIRGELRPDSGRIFLRDVDITGQQNNGQDIGVCPQFDALDLLTTRQHLEFYARIKGINGKEAKSNAEVAMARVGLAPHADKQAVKLSGGNRRKLSLAIALMGDPAVLILDEPSSAMDAAAKRNMWKALAEEIARLIGAPWDEELEPFRCAHEGSTVRVLHEVI